MLARGKLNKESQEYNDADITEGNNRLYRRLKAARTAASKKMSTANVDKYSSAIQQYHHNRQRGHDRAYARLDAIVNSGNK